MSNISSFSKAWRHITKPSKRRNRKTVKNNANRANRREGKKNLDYCLTVKLTSWDVT
jgi:hypothetical protein